MITRIGHLAFGITDLDASLEFYVTQLGLSEAFRLHKDDGLLWIVYLYVGNGTFVELFPGSATVPQSGSYRHLCLEVDDMPATLAELRGRGMAIEGDAKQGKDHNWQYWLTDPDGNRIELMQLSPESPQRAAIQAAEGRAV